MQADAFYVIDGPPGVGREFTAGGFNAVLRDFGRIGLPGCLAPDIVTAIVQGRQPASLTSSFMLAAELPLAWADQRRALGFA